MNDRAEPEMIFDKFEHFDEEFTIRVIDRIRIRREELGLTKTMLAALIGVDINHIYKIERFERKEMSIRTFFKIMNALNIEIKFLKKENQ